MGGFPGGQTMNVPRIAAGNRYEPNALMDALSKPLPRSSPVATMPTQAGVESQLAPMAKGPQVSMTGYNDILRYLGMLGKQSSFGVNALTGINDQY